MEELPPAARPQQLGTNFNTARRRRRRKWLSSCSSLINNVGKMGIVMVMMMMMMMMRLAGGEVVRHIVSTSRNSSLRDSRITNYDDDAAGGVVRYIGVDKAAAAAPSSAGAVFSSIQAAIDSVPDYSSNRTIIRISPGIFEERVVVPSTKPFITLQGAGMNLTYVQWHLKASDMGPNGDELTAYNSASVTIFASNFVAKDITFQNTLPPPPPGIDGRQAAAFRISGDMAAFYRCGFMGAQDTLCDDQGRHYYEDCFIQGSIDFVFGDARSFYNRCELNSIAQSYGSVAAQDRQSIDDNTGFVFMNCKVTGSGPLYLGRAMGPFSLIIFAYSYFEDIIDPRGWDDWDHDTSKDQTVYYGQYKCDGPGADESQRVGWSHELNDEEALSYLNTSFIDGSLWLSRS